MAGGTLFHKLGEKACFIGFSPFPGNLTENAVTHGTTLPVWNNRLFISGYIFFFYPVVGHLPVIEDAQVFTAVAGEFGKGGYDLWRRAAFADYEFAVTYIEGFMFAEMFEKEGTQYRQGVFPTVFLVEFCFQKGTLNGNRWFCFKAELS